jgi:malto-oligosyltrehalose trehalohydrolase
LSADEERAPENACSSVRQLPPRTNLVSEGDPAPRINFDGAASAPVRQFFIENALYWLREFHFDGLRLDAVHAIVDDSPRHLLDELAERVRQIIPGRTIHLILENEENEARHLERDPNRRPIHFTAQWNDDLHHVLHTAASGESAGYYEEYTGDTQKLARAIAEGFAFQGETMRFRGRARGSRSGHLPPDAFVAFIQNHDQIGNRAFGERLNQLADSRALRTIAAVYLLLPQIPMLFMGEEWNAPQPFPFFCDFHGELARSVTEGRRREFARFAQFQDPDVREQIPDPQAFDTYTAAKLDWSALQDESHREWLGWYRNILRIRAQEIVPRLPRLIPGSASYQVLGYLAIQARWRIAGGELLELIANLGASPQDVEWEGAGRCLLEHHEPGAPWSASWRIVRT